jgi:hypothetical protein
MKSIRSLAAGLMLLTGTLHLVSVAFSKFDPTSIITLVFGASYLAIGFYLFRNGRNILWFGAIVPLIGLLLAVAGMFMKPTLLGGIFIAIDVAVAACCFSLVLRKAQPEFSQ